jgi:hypothetical protein
MGDRVNFAFTTGETEPAIILYSHWGYTDRNIDLAHALLHAKPRWNDSGYGIRMIISHLMRDAILDETGFGIYAVKPEDIYDSLDETIVVDMVNKTVDGHEFDKYVTFHI